MKKIFLTKVLTLSNKNIFTHTITLMFIVLIGLFFLNSCSEEIATTNESAKDFPERKDANVSNNPTNSCSAESTISMIIDKVSGGELEMGSKCSVNCPEGTIPNCKASFWSASCWCSEMGGPNPGPTYTMPSVSPSILTHANNFKAFCLEHESEDINELGNIVANDILAVTQQDQEDFEYYEAMYNLAFFSLSSSDLEDIYEWIDALEEE
jgi:hypothetical protein